MAQQRSLRRNSFAKTVFVFFLSLLAFSLGTFVGKKFTENQNEIASLDQCNDRQTTVTASEPYPAPRQNNNYLQPSPPSAPTNGAPSQQADMANLMRLLQNQQQELAELRTWIKNQNAGQR